MARQSEQRMCNVYITPDERKLLAKVARGRGVGRDYLTLRRTGNSAKPVAGRPIPRWLGQADVATPKAPAPRRQRATRQARHCRSCVHLSPWPASDSHYVCAAAVWVQPMRAQSVRTSRRLRTLSLTCPRYSATDRPRQAAPRHCRACRELAPAETIDERYVCGRGVWTNPMTPLSVANARRLARISAACAHFAPSAGRWLPRS